MTKDRQVNGMGCRSCEHTGWWESGDIVVPCKKCVLGKFRQYEDDFAEIAAMEARLRFLVDRIKGWKHENQMEESMGNQRHQLKTDDLDNALEAVKTKLMHRAASKGMGVMASNHEIYGIIRQETTEYEETIHRRLSDGAKIEELLDIAVAACFGIASIASGGTDW